MRKHYSDYVRHCTRLYFNTDTTPNPLNDKVKYNNYISVSNVLDRYDSKTACMLREVYTSEIIPKAVDKYATKEGCKSEEIWYMIQRYEKDVAVERGLL